MYVATTHQQYKHDELHDSIALALDAVSCLSPTLHNLAEARGYLRDALRQIGGAA